MLVSLVSAKGSPGCTSTALVLAAAAGVEHRAVAVELDPSGGDVRCWAGGQPPGEPGLVALVAALRAEPDPDELLGAVGPLVPGMVVVTGPTAPTVAATTLEAGGTRLAAALAATQGLVVADAGRWYAETPTARVLQASTLVVVVARPTLDGVEHARHALDALRRRGHRVAIALVGERPYGPAEVEAALAAPVLGALAWDPGGLVDLVGGGVTRRWGRTPLARSAPLLLRRLRVTGEVAA